MIYQLKKKDKKINYRKSVPYQEIKFVQKLH